MYKLNQKKLFVIYFAFILIRVFFILNFYPEIQSAFYIPFINEAIKVHSLDVWQSWISSGGSAVAFPYGLGAFIPLAAPIYIIAKIFPMTELIYHMTLGLTLLFIDTFVLKSIIAETKSFKSVLLYAFSPLAIFITYYYGQLDLIPSSLMLFFLISIKLRRMYFAGIFLGLTVAAKFIFILIIPFLIIFYFNNVKHRESLKRLLLSSFLTLVTVLIPLIFSRAFQTMVLEAPEVKRILFLTINLSSTFTIFIFPTIYIGLLLWLWRAGRTTFDVLITFSTASLIAIAIFAPGDIGWFFWSLPLLALIAFRENTSFLIIVILFQILALTTFSDFQAVVATRFWSFDSIHLFSNENFIFQTLLETVYFSVGLVILISLLRTALVSGDIYSLNLKPISIAIAGDSGVGKDMLTNNLKEVFGKEVTAVIQGDNYHKFERNSLKWETFTHLNPEANDLKILISDLRKALKREPISRRTYDHKNGKFRIPSIIKPADFVVLNGLHSLSLGNAQELIDLNVFISMAETLRIKLKYQRDLAERNVSKDYVKNQILTRREDTKRYINSQAINADILFELREIDSSTNDIGDLELAIETRGFYFLQDLTYLLRMHTKCKLHFEMVTNTSHKLLLRNAEVDVKIVEQIMELLVPGGDQLLSSDYKLKSDIEGLMLLVTVLGVVEKRIGTKEVSYE